uniref:Uncharacterized protein n=1 Tax=Strongyloides papillosus TaxID=174720 RepID=A0A0N5C5D8_STREA
MDRFYKPISIVLSLSFIFLIIYDLVDSQYSRYSKYTSSKSRNFVALPSLITLNSSYELWVNKGVGICLEDNYLKPLMENIISNGVVYNHSTLFENHRKPELLQSLRNLNPRRPWKFYGISIHPIERFLDNFFIHCYNETMGLNNNKIICLGCVNDLTCLINKLYNRYWNLANTKKLPDITSIDYTFMPYSWRCNFKYNLKQYIKLKLRNEKEFREEIIKLMNTLRLEEEKQKYVNNYINEVFDNRIGNLLSNNARIIFEDEFKKNEKMRKKFISIYFHDYVNFNFKLSSY